VRTTPTDPTGAYFSTLCRAWELGTGALVAICVSPLTRIPGWLRSVMTWLGLGGVLVAAVTFTPQTPFPGYAAVLPVASAALIIIGGLGTARNWSAGNLLGHQPFRLIGDVSYGFYLWHWPFLIIPMEYQGHALSLTTNLELLLLALAVSFVTYWLVENPIRHSRRLLAERPRSLVLWPASLLITLLASAYYIGVIHDRLAVHATGGAPKDLTNAALVRAVGASVATSRLDSKVDARLSPSPAALRQDWFPVGSCVIPDGPQTSEQLCRWGDSAAQRTVVLFGDSHAHMWLAGVMNFATTRTYRLVPLIKGRCVASAWGGYHQTAACTAWNAWALGVIKRIKPAAVILGTSYFLKGTTTEHNAQVAGLSAEISALSAVAGNVLLLQDPPRLPTHPVDCLLAHGATYGSCTYPLASNETEFYARTNDAATQAGAAVVPTLQWFCSNDECPTVVGNTIAYLDTNHVSNTYATEAESALASELAESIRT
jgi:SGNH domain (fused to AT3 domains)